jgi:hypothetical protein
MEGGSDWPRGRHLTQCARVAGRLSVLVHLCVHLRAIGSTRGPIPARRASATRLRALRVPVCTPSRSRSRAAVSRPLRVLLALRLLATPNSPLRPRQPRRDRPVPSTGTATYVPTTPRTPVVRVGSAIPPRRSATRGAYPAVADPAADDLSRGGTRRRTLSDDVPTAATAGAVDAATTAGTAELQPVPDGWLLYTATTSTGDHAPATSATSRLRSADVRAIGRGLADERTPRIVT